jgi:hypothetical protein
MTSRAVRAPVASSAILLEKFSADKVLAAFIAAISSNEARGRRYRSDLSIVWGPPEREDDLSAGESKLRTSFTASAHKSSRYLGGSIKTKAGCCQCSTQTQAAPGRFISAS